jgi:hypothetical protein
MQLDVHFFNVMHQFFSFWTMLMVLIILIQIEKIPIDEIKKELNSVGMPQEGVNKLLEVLSIKSLSELEGQFQHVAGEATLYLVFLLNIHRLSSGIW